METLSTTPETAKTLGGVTVGNTTIKWSTIIILVVAIAAVVYFATRKNQTV